MNPVAADPGQGRPVAGLTAAATDERTGEARGQPAGGPGAGLAVAAADERAVDRSEAVDVGAWASLAEAVLRAENVTAGELNLVFVDPGEMARLNAEHMGEDGPTDVLSFPLDGADPHPIGARMVGDVVVCPAWARDRGLGAAGDRELALLVVHGVLHLLGYDHADPADAARMQARERQLLAAHYRRP